MSEPLQRVAGTDDIVYGQAGAEEPGGHRPQRRTQQPPTATNISPRTIRRSIELAWLPRRPAPAGRRRLNRQKKKPGRSRVSKALRAASRRAGPVELLRLDGVGLQTLLTLYDGERHLLAFLQALEALGLDGAEVNEHVFAILTADEAEALASLNHLTVPDSRDDIFTISLEHWLKTRLATRAGCKEEARCNDVADRRINRIGPRFTVTWQTQRPQSTPHRMKMQ
jgi:hypothetical protein